MWFVGQEVTPKYQDTDWGRASDICSTGKVPEFGKVYHVERVYSHEDNSDRTMIELGDLLNRCRQCSVIGGWSADKFAPVLRVEKVEKKGTKKGMDVLMKIARVREKEVV